MGGRPVGRTCVQRSHASSAMLLSMNPGIERRGLLNCHGILTCARREKYLTGPPLLGNAAAGRDLRGE